MLRRWFWPCTENAWCFSCHRPGVKLAPVDLLSSLDTVILPQMDWVHFVQQKKYCSEIVWGRNASLQHSCLWWRHVQDQRLTQSFPKQTWKAAFWGLRLVLNARLVTCAASAHAVAECWNFSSVSFHNIPCTLALEAIPHSLRPWTLLLQWPWCGA